MSCNLCGRYGTSKRGVVCPSDLEAYYRSIELPFWQAWRAVCHQDDPTGLFLFGFLLCLVPIIPLLASILLTSLYGRPILRFGYVSLEPSSFWLWWPTSAICSFILALLIGRSQGRLIEYKIKQLSPQQLRFAYCYGALDEIRRFRSSGARQHIGTADAYLEKLAAAMMRASTLDLAEGCYPYHYWQWDAWVGRRKEGEHASIGIRLKLPGWYRLQPESEEIVKAFPRLSRLRERAVDGEEIQLIEAALTDLGIFLYTEIANIPTAVPRDELERIGSGSLLGFARTVNALSPYKRKERDARAPGSLGKSLSGVGRWLTAVLTHENVIAVFMAWYLVTLAMEVLACVVAFHLFPELRIDTTLIATMIGTPFVVAAAALVLSKRASNPSD